MVTAWTSDEWQNYVCKVCTSRQQIPKEEDIEDPEDDELFVLSIDDESAEIYMTVIDSFDHVANPPQKISAEQLRNRFYDEQTIAVASTAVALMRDTPGRFYQLDVSVFAGQLQEIAKGLKLSQKATSMISVIKQQTGEAGEIVHMAKQLSLDSTLGGQLHIAQVTRAYRDFQRRQRQDGAPVDQRVSDSIAQLDHLSRTSGGTVNAVQLFDS